MTNASGSGFLNNPSAGTVAETFLLPVVYVIIATLAMGGDMVIRYCISRQELFKSPDSLKVNALNEDDEVNPGIIEVADSALNFFQFKRSRENFDRLRKENFPPKASKKLRTAYSVGRKVLYTTCRGTGMQRSLRSAVLLTCFAGLWAWVIILLQNVGSQDDGDLNKYVEQFLEHGKVLGQLTKSIGTYVSLLFAFFSIRSLALWTKVYNTCINLDEKLVQMGVRVSAIFSLTSNEEHLDMRWRMYRWLTCLNFLVLAHGSSRMRDKSQYFTVQLFESGLVDENEKLALDSSQMPSKTLLRWIAQALTDQSLTGAQPWPVRLRAVDDLLELKSAMVDIESLTLAYPPMSWAQIMNFLVDIYVAFIPILFVSTMYVPSANPNNKESTDVQIWPLLATFLVSTFFYGLMETVAILRDPLGVGIDDFNVDYILLRVERELLSLLGNADDDKLFSLSSFVEDGTKSFNPLRDGNMVHVNSLNMKGKSVLFDGEMSAPIAQRRQSITGWRGSFAEAQNPTVKQQLNSAAGAAIAVLKARYDDST